MGRQACRTSMDFRETFLQIQCRLLEHLIRKSRIHGSLMFQKTHHHMWWVTARHQFRIWYASLNRQPEIQSSPVMEDFQRNMEQTNNDCRFQTFISTHSPRQQRLLVGKRFKTEVCTYSQFPTEPTLWIKEVELVGSVGYLKSSCSLREIRLPDFEVLGARIASALNRIIHNSHFKRRVSLEEQKARKEDGLLRGRQIAYLIKRVLPGHWSQWFCRESCRPIYDALRNDDIQEFDSKWDGIFSINDENPIWWHLGRIVQIKNTTVWKTQDRIGIVRLGDSSEESWTWLSQIENDGEEKYRAGNSKLRILKPEAEILRRTPWSRIRG